jgi:hypothetical protein
MPITPAPITATFMGESLLKAAGWGGGACIAVLESLGFSEVEALSQIRTNITRKPVQSRCCQEFFKNENLR